MYANVKWAAAVDLHIRLIEKLLYRLLGLVHTLPAFNKGFHQRSRVEEILQQRKNKGKITY
jgi:uncharacterized membrane protein